MKMNQTQLNRMKTMMTYGLQTESKKNDFSGLEYKREAADGKMYGIVREGTKYYIKVSDKKNNVVKEDFNYIGGFRNRKDYEYNSYANALKNFDLKMASINESRGNKEPLVESWNPDKKEMLTVESTERMRREIARQREIMGNAQMINETKNYSHVDKACADTQKNNMKACKAECGNAVNTNGDPYTQKADKKFKKVQAPNIKGEGCARVNEAEQVLGWNDDENYLDMSSSTEVGDSAPYGKCKGDKCEMEHGTVEEGNAMHNTDNQNSPAVGVGEVGDDAPYTERAKNELQEDEEKKKGFFHNDELADKDQLEDPEEEILIDDEDFESEEGEFGDDEEMDFEITPDEEPMDDDLDVEEPMGDDFGADAPVTREEFDELMDIVKAIADKVGADSFAEDNLYDDDKMKEPMDGEEPELEEESVVYESRAYRRMMAEDKLNYFGKHPAYRKEPMQLPTSKHSEMADYYDMNDESVYSERPYGEKIGDSAPYDIDPETIENAIAESIKRALKKKI